MIRLYDDLPEQEQDKLSYAWLKIYEGLKMYEQITGAESLDDVMYDELWQQIEYQQSEEAA